MTNFEAGDQVYARPDKDRIGTFAEFIALDEKDLAQACRPQHGEAAAVPLVALTAWQATGRHRRRKARTARVHPGRHGWRGDDRHPAG